jgi:hypothetical protein
MIFASQSLELDGPVAKLGFQRLASRDLLAQRLVVFLKAQPAKSLLIQSEPGCHGHRRRSPSNETLFGDPRWSGAFWNALGNNA